MLTKRHCKLSGRMERPASAHPVPLPVGVAGDRHALRQEIRFYTRICKYTLLNYFKLELCAISDL